MGATFDFMKADFNGTLFPLKTNLIMAEMHSTELDKYIYQSVIDGNSKSSNFLPQQRVFATKSNGHLRRTVKLDPVSEYFIYDITYRNRKIFRPQISQSRQSFGYRFSDGAQIPVHSAYSEYKESLKASAEKYKHKIQFDIASYFNSLYHHDICHWFNEANDVSDKDQGALGQFFREINSGRSVDFLPQGIYPCKMIGNEFLKRIDLSGQIRSSKMLRFMDDFTLCDDNLDVITQDFIKIQQLLGQFGLNINPGKTRRDNNPREIDEALSEIEESLFEIVEDYEAVFYASGIEFIEVGREIEFPLDHDQLRALLALLKDERLEESDADRILAILHHHSDSILEQIPDLLRRFPNLVKHIHSLCGNISEKSELSAILLAYLKEDKFFLEYELFWITCIVEDHLTGHGCYGEALNRLFELTADYKIARAKILEIPEPGFGLRDIRSEYLKTGQSDWLSWASAIGSRSLKAAERNYVLDYFSKGSNMNYLIAECTKKF